MAASKKKILVLDIPKGASAEQTETLLNEPCENGYYLDKIHLDPAGLEYTYARAFFRLRARPEAD